MYTYRTGVGETFGSRSLEYYIILGTAEIPVSEDTTISQRPIECSTLRGNMKVSALLLAFGTSIVWSAPSTLDRTIGSKELRSEAVRVSRYIGPSNYPGYFVYNYLQIDQNRGIPFAVFADGSPSVTHVQPIYNYYGTPFYDYIYPFNQVYPGFPGFRPPAVVPGEQPSLIPAQRPMYPPTTQRPLFDVDDGIEKLDEKVDPSLEDVGGGSSHPNDDDDTVTIDAI